MLNVEDASLCTLPVFLIDKLLISRETPVNSHRVATALSMAIRPISRPTSLPDPSMFVPQSPGDSRQKPREDVEPGTDLSRLANTLSLFGGGASSGDLALDIILNEIVQEARLATHAAGAALALLRDGSMVCRATTGVGGPNLGMQLEENAGLSGIALKTCKVQMCEDSETDERLDPGICRELGIRSILVVPILGFSNESNPRPENSVPLGLIEVFSPYPQAFGDQEVETLSTFRAQILRLLAPPAIAQTFPSRYHQEQELHAPEVEPSPAADAISSEAVSPPRSREYWTATIAVGIIAAAFLLGWTWGRGNDSSSKGRTDSTVAAPVEGKSDPAPPTKRGEGNPNSGASPTANPGPRRDRERSPGGLVVYDKGKVIYRSRSSKNPPAYANMIPRVVKRVQPVYPDSARQQSIEGPVELDVLVDTKGLVEQVKILSGNPILASSATDAISQWRFEPLLKDGKAVSFETQIKVGFKLPGK
ncbi:MAG: TonB family protein [Acidobacteriaceae bacterium]